MLISTPINWNAVNWPATTPAAFYPVFIDAATSPDQIVTEITALVTYDDSDDGHVYFVRPCDADPATSYGPAQTVVIARRPLNNRAWMRSYVRRAIADRIDTGLGTPTVEEDLLDDCVIDALRQYSHYFPGEKTQVYTLSQAALRNYILPADFIAVKSLKYAYADGHFELFLKDEPYKAGETTGTSYFGYPKLGILQPPIGGRFYPGHYEISFDEVSLQRTLTVDFDVFGNGDTLTLRYNCLRNFPQTDTELLDVPPQDIEMLAIYVQAKAWLRVEASDVYLSRWRTREDGGSRKDLPTELMSSRLFNAWETWVNQRLSERPRMHRLVRRA